MLKTERKSEEKLSSETFNNSTVMKSVCENQMNEKKKIIVKSSSSRSLQSGSPGRHPNLKTKKN